MITQYQKPKARLTAKTLAVLTLLTASGLPYFPTAVQAADPYDKSLEARVEALERELNVMENDSKGKNVSSTDVPTFLRASKNVQELTISGEVRFRYENDDVTSNVTGNDSHGIADRERFRFRLFADYKLTDQFFAGAAVQTALAADSGNTTFSEGFDNYSLYLWRFFVGWKSKDDNIKITVGKFANPLYLETEMLWDADISPTGLAEQFKLPISPQFDLAFNAGQYIFYDNNENSLYNEAKVPGGDNNQDAYLLTQQLVATFKPTNKLSVTGAGGYQFYLGHGGTNSISTPPGAAAPTTGGPLTGQTPNGANNGNGTGQGNNQLQNADAFRSANATRNLSIVFASADVKLDLGAFKVKVYGDGAYNFQGGSRVTQEYGQGAAIANDTNKIAFSTGVTFGSDYTIKKKGDYFFLAEYRQVGLGSIDPNLNDSDWNLSALGFRGFKGAVSYGFYPWLIGTVTYYNGYNLEVDHAVTTLGTLNTSQVIQVDLTAKF